MVSISSVPMATFGAEVLVALIDMRQQQQLVRQTQDGEALAIRDERARTSGVMAERRDALSGDLRCT